MKKPIYFLLCICAFNLFVLSNNALADLIQTRIRNYKNCVETLVDQGLPWLNAFSVCGAGNSAKQASTCLEELALLKPAWTPEVNAFACAGQSSALVVSNCMSTLLYRNGEAFDPSITNSACSGGSPVDGAETCMKDLIPNYGNVIAGIACAGGNTSASASQCLESLVPDKIVLLSPACGGSNNSGFISRCIKRATNALKGLAGTTGQELRAAGNACASSNF